MTQIMASSTSRIWPAVIRSTPQKMEHCWVTSSDEKVRPKSITRYLVRLPVSIRQAIQYIVPPGPEREGASRTTLAAAAEDARGPPSGRIPGHGLPLYNGAIEANIGVDRYSWEVNMRRFLSRLPVMPLLLGVLLVAPAVTGAQEKAAKAKPRPD